ncbi:hypothetical protein L596_004066 [Steinernema carpocapsae]|nr:hypothetical protein L596_004066 [Steinernema carpocapsae]
MLHAIGSSDLIEADMHTIVIENACTKTNSDKEEAFWSEWSDCKYRMRGHKVRVRTRECHRSADCQNFQTDEC